MTLAYPSKCQNLATKCLAVAKFCGIDIREEIREDLTRIILEPSSGKGNTIIKGADGICFHLADEKEPNFNSSSFLQWTSLANSELSHYSEGSVNIKKGLMHLQAVLQTRNYISGLCFGVNDIMVAYPLLALCIKLDNFPRVKKWADETERTIHTLSGRKFEASGDASPPKQSKKAKDKVKIPKKVVTASSKKGAEKKKMKILCLHGYDQSAESFRAKLGSFRKLLSKQAELEFLTAPHAVPAGEFGWWGSGDTPQDAVAPQLAHSLDVVAQALNDPDKDFDGLMCFSQGSSLGAHLCMLKEKGDSRWKFRFCILVGGYLSSRAAHRPQFDELSASGASISTPTLHVFGETDKVIEASRSRELLEFFKDPVVANHEGGHFVPTAGEAKKWFTDFLSILTS